MKTAHLSLSIAIAGVVAALAFAQSQSIVDTPHNLSVGGPGALRATSEEQICIFCHTPHNSAPIQPLWNRYLPVAAYSVYTSNALDAKPGQPTGSSKLCLSCHDGTIAVGSVISRDQIIQMAGGITTLPAGSSANLGTDLADDHPISFVYDSLLVSKDPHLIDPGGLPPEIRLDVNRELQCTTCHNAHDNAFGNFLASSNDNSALCRSCHQISNTTITEHQDCRSCHQTHSAPSGPYLLQGDRITTTCLTCHDGSHAQAANIGSDLMKFSVHDTDSPVDPVDPIPGHVTCADCHDPHTMMSGSASAPSIHPSFGQIDGINASGSPVDVASAEYEVCFKCHSDTPTEPTNMIPRQIVQTNTRMEFSLSAVSSHPVMGPGQNPNVPSLKPGWTESSVMYCSDCHGSDTSLLAGSSGPNGVHGSDEEPVLIARYETADNTPESASAYALCYTCHWRDGPDGILSDRSFPHSEHLEEDISCAACHDSHGISSTQGNSTNNSNLINFDTSIVFPDPDTGFLKYESLGQFSGQCYLTCHGEDHSAEDYAQ